MQPTVHVEFELQDTKLSVFQVNGVHLNTWARNLEKRDDGHFYYRAPKGAKWLQGVNTWLPVDTVQRYLRDQKSTPAWGGVTVALTQPRFYSIMDYVGTLRAACSSPASASWWFSNSLWTQVVASCALHYMAPWQALSIKNALLQPQWATEALLGTRPGDEKEMGVPTDPKWAAWGTSKAMVVYHRCLPSMLVKIVHDGFSRKIGQGSWQRKEVYGVTTAGVHVPDRPATACSEILIEACIGPAARAGYSSSEIISEDGTIPMKCVLRCLADPTGLLFRREEEKNRIFCFMPDALYSTHVTFVGQHPRTVWWGTTTSKWANLTQDLRTPAGRWSVGLKDHFSPWAFSDP